MVAAVRTFLTFVLILAVIAGAVALFLYLTTPHETAGVSFPLTPAAHALLADVPASAAAFAYVPHAAALDPKLRRNAITRDIVDSWRSDRALPRPWMIGAADLLVWESGGKTRYLLRLDPIRATIVRVYLMASGDMGGTILINAPQETPIASDELARIEALASKLPAGEALVVQRASSRGAFPPIGRPVASSVSVTDSAITIDCRSAAEVGGRPPRTLDARLARTALLATSFVSPPRML